MKNNKILKWILLIVGVLVVMYTSLYIYHYKKNLKTRYEIRSCYDFHGAVCPE